MIYKLILFDSIDSSKPSKKDVKIKTIINLEMAMILKVQKFFKHLPTLFLLAYKYCSLH